jgi:hypothetical protein
MPGSRAAAQLLRAARGQYAELPVELRAELDDRGVVVHEVCEAALYFSLLTLT